MDIKSIAAVMYPYWLMGAFVIWATIKGGNKDVVRVEKKPLMSWIKFLVIITCYRIVMFKLFAHGTSLEETAKTITTIPWPLTLTVFWEDACHGLPLLLLRNFIGTDKWWKWLIHAPLLAMVMLEFGLGHVYQGVFAAAMLSLYIPYSIHLGRKHGFGTVMIGHTLYDLTTILSLKFLLGA
jgi:hypothetical protein